MTYAAFIEKTTSKKILLIEMDLGLDEKKWYNYDAGIWAQKWSLTGELHNIGDGNIGDFNMGEGDLKTFQTISSCFVDTDEYTEQASLANCVSTEKSWYYDDTNFIFYIHIDNGHEPQIHGITIGLTVGMRNGNEGGYYEDLYYEPRIIEAANINRVIGDLFYGLVRQDSWSFSLRNNDGFLDGIPNYNLFGQPVRALFGGDDLAYSSFENVFTGYLDNLGMAPDKIDISVVGEKKKLSIALPANVFDQTTYPYLDDDDIGKPIPIGYGPVYKAPVICTNKAQTGSPNWTFKICDTADHTNGIQSVDHVYVDGTGVSISSSDLSAGTVTIANGAWDGNKEVLVTFKGLKNSSNVYVTSALDIILDLLDIYAGVTYSSSYFNTTEWAAADSHALNNSLAIFIDNDTTIGNIIGEICSSVFGYFIVQGNGKYTFRIFDADAEVQRTIYKEGMLGPPEMSWPGSEYLTDCKIGYKKNWGKKSFRWHVEDTNKTIIYNKYKKYSSKSFETLLTNAIDAQELAKAIMDYYQDVKAIYSISTKTQNIQLDVVGTIAMEINRITKNWLDFVKTEIIGINKNLMEDKITISARHISNFTSPFYRWSPYAINIVKYAINEDGYAYGYARKD